MTKEKTLRACVSIFIWLHEHPSSTKADYDYIRYHGRTFKFDCPCCAYTEDADGVECDKCPLLLLWGKSPYYRRNYRKVPCEQQFSPYQVWRTTSPKDTELRKRYSLIIIRGCEDGLRKMKKKVEVYKA